MKPRISNQGNHALTLIEVLVVIVVLGVLAAMLLPANSGNRRKAIAMRIACVNNLKQIEVAFRIWPETDPTYPMRLSTNRGGTFEYTTTGEFFRHFQILSNVLTTPKILICPADVNRVAATSFTTDFNNSKIRSEYCPATTILKLAASP
jgi:prepilin-type N-terminal cleavage/methylation domain-containing protein